MPEIAEETRVISKDKDNYQKSNFLISSVYKSTLVENRTLAVILSRIQTAHEDLEGSIICSVKVETLRRIFNFKGNGFYDYLDTIGKRMTEGGRTIGFSNPEKKEFMYVPLITKAECKNGEFSVRFAPEMKKYLKDFQGQFTELSLKTMLSFDSVYSLRLFELMKSMAYYPKNMEKRDSDVFCIETNLSQLKLQMGVVNGESKKIKRTLTETGKKGEPDYDLAVSRADEKMYETYGQFNRRCLAPAVKEINEKDTGMNLEYERIKSGKGGLTVGIRFFVKLDSKFNQIAYGESGADVEDVRFDSEDDFIDALRDRLDDSIKLKTAEIRKIGAVAEYNLTEAIRAIEYAKGKSPDNFVGYVIETIKNKYYEPQERVITKSTVKDTESDKVANEIPPLRAEEIINKM